MERRLPKGAECQCVGCGLFFSGLTAFDLHHRNGRRGRRSANPVVCQDPRQIGMVLFDRKSGPTWGLPGENPYGGFTPDVGTRSAVPGPGETNPFSA